MDPLALTTRIAAILDHRPGIPARDIVSTLADSRVSGLGRTTVNSCLYSNRDTFYSEGASPPLWYVHGVDKRGAGVPPQPTTPRSGGSAVWADALALYPWQVRALDGWAASSYRGVVEAVTGAGKTRLALAAIEAELRRGGRAVAIVPTLDLQTQWVAEIQAQLFDRVGVRARVGTMGGGYFETLQSVEILVATVQSACQRMLGLTQAFGLLVADEVHHYGAEVWSGALETAFDRRLGLTATYEREDDGVETVLDPYFGSYRYSLGYREALSDDVIAHFKIAFVGVTFDQDEQDRYVEADEKARRRRSKLVNVYGLTPEPFGVFMRQVVRLSKSGEEGARDAGLYLSSFSKRRQILAAARAKFEYLREVAPAIRAADSTILFSQTRDAAERAVEILERSGITGGVLHAALDAPDRRDVFDAFRDGTNQFIAAPKLLDEGVDVPDADLAIILASSRSRRQMIQRMGRVIRKKEDGRRARVLILYVEGTSEDPTEGAHEDFVQFVIDAADDVRVFATTAAAQTAVQYLNDW